MKQHITFEEFYSLGIEEQESLLSIIERKDLSLIDFGTTHELFTVGKMIEILSIYESSYNINFCEGEYCLILDRGMGGIEIPTNCLVDSLWEAVKEVLKDGVDQ